jgi:hypothetical protein
VRHYRPLSGIEAAGRRRNVGSGEKAERGGVGGEVLLAKAAGEGEEEENEE